MKKNRLSTASSDSPSDSQTPSVAGPPPPAPTKRPSRFVATAADFAFGDAQADEIPDLSHLHGR